MNREETEQNIRQIHRAERLRKRQGQMKQHGGSLFRIYRNAVSKRLKRENKKKP